MNETSIWDFKAKAGTGTELDFSSLKGGALLVVNTASKCGFTHQYEGLEELYRKFKAKGFTVVAFPCDQFAHQEPEDDAGIKEFCERNYGVSFPLMAKTEVNGEGTHPVFAWLKKKAPGIIGPNIKWNFTKFLIAPDGRTVKRYAPATEPAELTADIEKML